MAGDEVLVADHRRVLRFHGGVPEPLLSRTVITAAVQKTNRRCFAALANRDDEPCR